MTNSVADAALALENAIIYELTRNMKGSLSIRHLAELLKVIRENCISAAGWVEFDKSYRESKK